MATPTRDETATHRPRPTRRAWVRLDNASNIFLAARNEADTKVFRLSAELDHDVDPARLQHALDLTFDRYPLHHAVLRRGIFWYYLQDSDLRPQVGAEDRPSCAPIYQADRRTLLFRVVHHRRRIVLETFHALSDGTGALWFLTDLVTAYLENADEDGSEHRPEPRPEPLTEPVAELAADSFTTYFRRRGRGEPTASETAFTRLSVPTLAAPPPPVTAPAPTATSTPTAPAEPDRPSPGRRRGWRAATGRVQRIRGTRTPDNRTRAVELTVPTTGVLALARAEGVSLTIYLTAVFFAAVRSSTPARRLVPTLSASVPVNLRQFFPSTSPRNFFATVTVEHTYGEGPDDLGAVCRQLDTQFRALVTPVSLERKLRRFIRFERSPALRIVPRPLKDVFLKLINLGSNRGISVAVSNLGRVDLPEATAAAVRRLSFHVSAARPQLSAISHADLLTVTFTSPFVETDHVRAFARHLSAAGVPVTVAAERVTEAELATTRPDRQVGAPR